MAPSPLREMGRWRPVGGPPPSPQGSGDRNRSPLPKRGTVDYDGNRLPERDEMSLRTELSKDANEAAVSGPPQRFIGRETVGR